MQKRRIKKTKTTLQFLKTLLWAAGAIVIIYYFIIGDYGVITQLRLAQQEREARAKIEVINQEQKNLNRQIARLMEDTAYQEKIAREKYKLAKKGETIYLMVPRPSDSANHKKR